MCLFKITLFTVFLIYYFYLSAKNIDIYILYIMFVDIFSLYVYTE
jgi:hypothetical protein